MEKNTKTLTTLIFATPRTSPNPFCRGKEKLALIALKGKFKNFACTETQRKNMQHKNSYGVSSLRKAKTLIYQVKNKITLCLFGDRVGSQLRRRLASNTYPHERLRSRASPPAHSLRSTRGEERDGEDKEREWAASYM